MKAPCHRLYQIICGSLAGAFVVLLVLGGRVSPGYTVYAAFAVVVLIVAIVQWIVMTNEAEVVNRISCCRQQESEMERVISRLAHEKAMLESRVAILDAENDKLAEERDILWSENRKLRPAPVGNPNAWRGSILLDG